MPVGGRQVGGAVADLVSGWSRWRPGQFATPPQSPLGGETPGSIKVELFIAEQWVDVTRLDRDTPGVYYRDAIAITRGKADESAQLDRGTCTFTLNNRDGRFSPRNPMSPYYGKLTRNTPCRVSVVQSTGVRRYRFHGEVSSWPQKWDISGTDVYVPVEASGVLRRLGQGSSPLASAMYRVCNRSDRLVAYWPCEDEASAASIGSAVTGVKAMAISGTPTLASNTDFHASADLPVMGSASFTGPVPAYDTSVGQAQVSLLVSVPTAGATNGQIICSVYTNGNVPRWELYYGTGGTLGLRGFDGDGSNVADTGAFAFAVNGAPMRVSLGFAVSGSNVSGTITTLSPGASSAFSSSAASVAGTLGRVVQVVAAPNRGLTTTAIGHILVQSSAPDLTSDLTSLANQTNASYGEHAGPRIERLCTEETINFRRVGTVGTSAAMGYQTVSSFVDLVRAAVDLDMGRLMEPRDQVGLAYRDRETLYNQTAVLALDYSAHNLSSALDPVDDDTYTRNDVTVKRDTGSSTRVTRDTGALSIANAGRYDTSVTLNAYTDTQLADLAGWLLHLGTTDEARYPTVDLNLNHSTFTSSDSLTTAALVLDIGDRVTIANPPPWLPPDTISLVVEGYTERITGLEHTLTLNCSPESPYHIGVYDNSTWRYASDGSTLTSDLDSVTTSVRVTTPSGPLWSVTDGSFDIVTGGERMTVTAISGTTSPQTFTVTRSVNGIVKTHSAGDDVSLFTPAYYAI